MKLRLLVDHNANEKYTETFLRTDWIEVVTVSDELYPEATDREIANYAERDNWVVFAGDKGDFENINPDCGLVVYHQIENPSPGDVIDALRRIAESFDDHNEIYAYVPSEWV